METLLITKSFAIMYLIVGISILISPLQFKKGIEGLFKNNGLLLFVGMISLLFGAAIISYHSKWNTSWEIVISMIGYLAVLKGFLYMTFPKRLEKIAKSEMKSKKSIRGLGIFCIALSAGFFYKALWCGCLG